MSNNVENRIKVVNSVSDDVIAEMQRIKDAVEKQNVKIDKCNRTVFIVNAVIQLAAMVAGITLYYFHRSVGISTFLWVLMCVCFGLTVVCFLPYSVFEKERKDLSVEYTELMVYKRFADDNLILGLFLEPVSEDTVDGCRTVCVVGYCKEDCDSDHVRLDFPVEYTEGACEPTLDLAEGKLYIPKEDGISL